jgi:hypothetical protein
MAGLRQTIDILNQKGTPAFYSDTFANRPTYGFKGRVFIATDTQAIYEDTGSAWTLIANVGSPASTPNLQAVCSVGNTYSLDIYLATTMRVGKGVYGNANNIAIGVTALNSVSNSFGDYNVAIGTTSCYSLTSGNSNTSVGYQSGYSMTNALQNVCIGINAGYSMTTASANTFVGNSAGRYTSTYGSYNTCIGSQADTQGSIGSYGCYYNTMIGASIGGSISAYTAYNTFVGYSTASGYTSNGSNGLNTIIGALVSVSGTPTMQNNIVLGDNSGQYYRHYASGNTVIGNVSSDNGIHALQVVGGINATTLSATGTTFSSNTTISSPSASNYYYVYTGAGGNTITLPTPLNNNNIYVFISAGFSFSVNAPSGTTILQKNLGMSLTSYSVNNYSSIMLIADGNNKFYQIVN